MVLSWFLLAFLLASLCTLEQCPVHTASVCSTGAQLPAGSVPGCAYSMENPPGAWGRVQKTRRLDARPHPTARLLCPMHCVLCCSSSFWFCSLGSSISVLEWCCSDSTSTNSSEGKQQHCEDSGMAEGSAVPPRICFSLTLAARCSAATRASAAVMLLVLRESQRGHGDTGLQEGTAGTEPHLFSIFGQGLGLLHSSWCTRTCFPLTHTPCYGGAAPSLGMHCCRAMCVQVSKINGLEFKGDKDL